VTFGLAFSDVLSSQSPYGGSKISQMYSIAMKKNCYIAFKINLFCFLTLIEWLGYIEKKKIETLFMLELRRSRRKMKIICLAHENC
jgi:hypothetical protein